MKNYHFLLQSILPCLVAYSSAVHAAPITWIAQSPNNNMNDIGNWSSNTIPGSADDAIFNSSRGVDTNPTESSLPFSVSTFNFPNNASVFNFNFNKQTLTFNGAGITGANTNPTITVANTDNGSFVDDFISFVGGTGTSGSSIITSTNSATLAGNASNSFTGSINSNLHSEGDFIIANGGNIKACNTGIDRAIGTGSNGTANTGKSLLLFDQSFTARDNVTISVENSGTFSGTNSGINAHGDSVAVVNGSQFLSSGAFQAGNNFNCNVQNTGNDSSLGIGESSIGECDAAQMLLETTGSVGNNCSISISNKGINSSQTTTNNTDYIGYVTDEQFGVGGTFEAGDNFNLKVSNIGTDTSNGYGGYQVAVITSNSGSTGTQILFQEGGTLGDYATISATNSGTYSGTNTHGGSNVGGMNLQQISFGVYTPSPEPYTFSAGDYFNLSACSSGTDSSNGTGGNAVGDVSEDQITFFIPATLGNQANISITNTGNFSGNASSTIVTVGSAGGGQLDCIGRFSAGDNFTLCAYNSGTNTGTGVGNFFIGDIGGQQVSFQDGLFLGNNASITISNSGSNSSDTTNGDQVGSFTHYGKQFLVNNQFHIGNDFVLKITNCGFDDSTGSGGNYVGFMNNDTTDDSASQFHLASGGRVGDRASFTLSNTGTYQGSNTTGGNAIGVLAGQQLYSVNDFHAGDDFELTVCNTGIDNASGQNSHSMGTIGRSQVEFGGACVLGTNATISLSNSGTNNDTTGTSNNIGVIGGAQMLVDGNFSAGPGLNISADNASISAGNANNNVGYVNNSQLVFSQGCTLNDGTVISAVNSGGIGNSQIVFGQGFDIVSGKVTIQAVNTGTVEAFGIDIEGSNAGGDANIILSDSSLNIGTTLPTFTIGALNGDSTSVVQSQPQLIINTDALTQSVFVGVIQDFPATSSTLMKTGAGTQTLSGINTYTGLTTVDEGILVLNGSLAGDVLINPLGTLKGNGTIVGTLTNTGVVAPGQSIGTMIAGNYINDNGTYDLEANGRGQSDLILVSGTATLNGGTVVVSSADGTFRIQQPYTILTADGGVSGTFTNATSLAFIKPILTYDPNNVYVTLQSTLVTAAEKCNQLGVATNLDSIVGPNAAQSLLIGTLANLPLADAQEALESLSGFQYTNDVLVSEISTSRLLRRLYDPLRSIVAGCDCCSPCDECTAWLETGYGFTNLQGSSAHKLNFDSYQVTGGFQKTVCCDFTFGLAGSYEYDHVTYRDGKTNRNAEFASVYGLYRPCMFYGLVDFVYGYSSNHLKRTIEVGNLRYKAHSKPNYNNLTFYGEAGFDLECECALIQPFLGIQIGRNWRNQINENQSDGWGLILCKHDWMSTRSRLGLHITTCNLCDCIDTSVDIAWNQLWSSSKISNVGRFNQFGNAFPICGNKLDNYSFDYAVTFTSCLCEGLKGYLELDGEWWQHANTFNVIGGIEYSF